MKIRAGYEILYDCPQPTPMILALSVHPSRIPDLLVTDRLQFAPDIAATEYRDVFDNICHVIRAPAGRLKISTQLLVRDNGEPDPVDSRAAQSSLETLPVDTLAYLLGSRYCETDRLTDIAWSTFGKLKGWALVQAICGFVHERVAFGYQYASPAKTAWDVYNERRGVCRDFAHLAITFCRCMNVPARYCTGYLGDIGVPPDPEPMDFSAWFEAYLGGRWHTFDARHNTPRIGRILMAKGRDATDVAIVTSFGPCTLKGFKVITELAAAVTEPAGS